MDKLYESVKFYLLFIAYYEYKLPKFILFISIVYCLVIVSMFRLPFGTLFLVFGSIFYEMGNIIIIIIG